MLQPIGFLAGRLYIYDQVLKVKDLKVELSKRLDEVKTAIAQTEMAFHALVGRRDELTYLLSLEDKAKSEVIADVKTVEAEVMPSEGNTPQ